MNRDSQQRLIWHGVLLLLLGLLTGAIIPLAANPRLGLSAHVGGVQNGILLVVFGFVWPFVELGAAAKKWALGLALASLYGLWAANVLGAFLGTGLLTPIAGEGREGAAWAEALVGGILSIGAVAIVISVVLILRGLRAQRSLAA